MNLQLTDKVAIVTGASRGIGLAIAQRLAEEGMRLVLAARSRDALDALAASLPTECLVHVCDLREPDAAHTLITSALEKFGRIDLLVNNAGATLRGDFLTLTDTDWNEGFALKFFGAMRCCRAAWPHLQTSSGSIVIISGIGGRTGNAEFTIGGAVNAALLNFTKALAHRGTTDGIRVNAINPASIATERLATRIRNMASEQHIDEANARARLAQTMGVTRFGKPEEVASVVAFLASPQASYCQGTLIDVDGGQTRTL